MEYTLWHNVLAGILLSTFVACEAGNILFIGSICIKKMRKINSITMDILRCLVVCGLLAAVLLLIPASVTAIIGRPLLGSKECFYQRLFLQIFEMASKMLMVFLGVERLVISLYRRGIRMSNAILKRSLVGVFTISVTVSCLSLIKDEEDQTEEGTLTCKLPGNLFTVSYEICLSLMLCMCVIVLMTTSCRRSIVCNISQIQERNSGEQNSISRPSINLNTNVGILPNIEIKTTLAIICLMLPVASLYLAGSIMKLLDLIYYHGDSLMTNLSLILHSLVYLGQPFLLYAVRITVHKNVEECMEERRGVFTRTTTSFHIANQSTHVETAKQSSAQVKKPSVTIGVNFSPLNSRYNRKNDRRLSCISEGTIDSFEYRKGQQRGAMSPEEIANPSFSNSKEKQDQLSLENTGSVANSEDSVFVRIGSSIGLIDQASLCNSNTTVHLHEVKSKLSRSVSECYLDKPKFPRHSWDNKDIYPSELGPLNLTAKKMDLIECADDQIKDSTKKQLSHESHVDNVNITTTANMPEVEPERISVTHGSSKSSTEGASSVDSQLTRSRPGIFIEVKTEEMVTRVWKKESDTGELISSTIFADGGASRDDISQ